MESSASRSIAFSTSLTSSCSTCSIAECSSGGTSPRCRSGRGLPAARELRRYWYRADGFNGIANDLFVPAAVDFIQYYAADGKARIEFLTSQDQGGGRAGHLRGVDDEHNGGAENSASSALECVPAASNPSKSPRFAFDQIDSARMCRAGEMRARTAPAPMRNVSRLRAG